MQITCHWYLKHSFADVDDIIVHVELRVEFHHECATELPEGRIWIRAWHERAEAGLDVVESQLEHKNKSYFNGELSRKFNFEPRNSTDVSCLRCMIKASSE